MICHIYAYDVTHGANTVNGLDNQLIHLSMFCHANKIAVNIQKTEIKMFRNVGL